MVVVVVVNFVAFEGEVVGAEVDVVVEGLVVVVAVFAVCSNAFDAVDANVGVNAYASSYLAMT